MAITSYSKRIRRVADVARWRLCVGCGACVPVCPQGSIRLANELGDGLRPRIDEGRCKDCGECLKVCIGVEMAHKSVEGAPQYVPGLALSWGPVLEIWEGYAADPDIRYMGSSGGLASSLALFCIERESMQGILHVGTDEEDPLTNQTAYSRSRSEVLQRTGSRYSPASPCDGIGRLESATGPCVFIGKPCDVAGLRKAQELRPSLDRNVGLVIGIFCAGTPATQGTLDLLKRLDIDPNQVEELRYRGRGWPGKFAVKLKGEGGLREVTTYLDAWSFIQKYRPYRCYLCPDATSEFADISCGDPWYRPIREGEMGHSLVLVRTDRGKAILRRAIAEGYVELQQADPGILKNSQPGMQAKRGAVWGRMLAMKAFRVPTPRLGGFSLFQNWLGLSSMEKVRSVLGTARRTIQRRYYRPYDFS